MDDRELLEMAARAAGLVFEIFVDGKPIRRELDGQPVYWNPLTDDGDALRLAVALKLTINPYTDGVFVSRNEGEAVISEPFDAPGCDAEATRRAIVRAAAEIARAGAQKG